MHIKDEFGDAITDMEQKFYYLVDHIFRETKKALKKPGQKPILIKPKEISPYEPVIKILTRHFSIEEIFLFNQQEVYSADQKTTVLYLLIISDKISNQDHFDMMQMVAQQTGGRFNIVPIAHQKAWIQERLFVHQDFFKKVMIPENSIFRADVPTIMHWITIDANADTDEGIYYRLCNELYKNYKLLRSKEDHPSTEGMGLILSDSSTGLASYLSMSPCDTIPTKSTSAFSGSSANMLNPRSRTLTTLSKNCPLISSSS